MANPNALSYMALSFARAAALSLLLAAIATGIVSCGGSTSNGGGGGGSNTFSLIVQAKTTSGTTNLQTISITVP